MNTSGESDIGALKLAVGLYVIVFAMKLAVYFMTGVMALFAEALHTLSDIFVSSFLLVAIIWSRKEADEVHDAIYRKSSELREYARITAIAVEYHDHSAGINGDAE